MVAVVLSLLYLLVAPLTAQPHHDWAILVGSCFATFVLADTTITNARGSDAHRVHPAPAHREVAGTNPDHQEPGAPGGVGTPILIAAAVITLAGETPARLLITLPAVLRRSWSGWARQPGVGAAAGLPAR